jgi:hypothetical protein
LPSDEGNPARYAELATSVGGGCTAGQVMGAFTELRRESGKVQHKSSELTGEQRRQIREGFAANEKGGAARYAGTLRSANFV